MDVLVFGPAATAELVLTNSESEITAVARIADK